MSSGVAIASTSQKRYTSYMPNPLITQSSDVSWGAAVFAGTRVPVEILFNYLSYGATLEEFLDGFPTVTREQAIAVLQQASAQMVKLAQSY